MSSNSETFNLTSVYTDPNSSEVITLEGPGISYPNDNVGNLIITSNKIKGDGYYGRSDGLHTIQFTLNDVTSLVYVQGTLETNPTETDWFPVELEQPISSDILGIVDTTGAVKSAGDVITLTSLNFENTTDSTHYNFVGNYVWIRVYTTDWTSGTINSIRLNH